MIHGSGTMVRGTVQAVMALVVVAALAQEPEATLTVTAPSETARVGHPVHIVYDVSWEGEPQSLNVLPVELETMEWGTATLVKSEAYRDQQLNHVVQTVAVTPGQAGEHHVPEFNIPLRYPEATFPTEKRTDESGSPHPSAYPTLRADPLPLNVRAARSPAWLSGGLGAFLFLLGAAYYLVARRRRLTLAAAPTLSPEERFSQARQTMHAARRNRLDGNFHAYYTDLGKAASLFDAPELRVRLDEAAQRVAYASVRPTDDDLEAAWREVERAAAKRRDHP